MYGVMCVYTCTISLGNPDQHTDKYQQSQILLKTLVPESNFSLVLGVTALARKHGNVETWCISFLLFFLFSAISRFFKESENSTKSWKTKEKKQNKTKQNKKPKS